ncbi:formate dehydrogenase subunit delta [bacterium]|nr:formate dehydrogenase subunit delta [bacterium]
MAMIKSALELALERTKNLKVDEVALEAARIKTEGRKTAGKFLEEPEATDIAAAVRAVADSGRERFRKSLFEVLAAQIQLPGAFFDEEKLAKIGAGLGKLAETGAAKGAASASELQSMVQQIAGFLKKYQDEVKRVEQAIRNQWAPRFKEKERQMAARVGQEVRLDPMADPEFAAFYKQNVEALRTNYADALERAKVELTALCGIDQDEDEEPGS